MSFRPAACLLAALAVVAATAAPASADTVTFTDRRGDAPARYDLTRTSISNGQDRLVVVQRVRNLRGGRTQIYGFNAFGRDGQGAVHVVRRKNGIVNSRVFGPEGEVACDIRARWRLAGT